MLFALTSYLLAQVWMGKNKIKKLKSIDSPVIRDEPFICHHETHTEHAGIFPLIVRVNFMGYDILKKTLSSCKKKMVADEPQITFQRPRATKVRPQ